MQLCHLTARSYDSVIRGNSSFQYGRLLVREYLAMFQLEPVSVLESGVLIASTIAQSVILDLSYRCVDSAQKRVFTTRLAAEIVHVPDLELTFDLAHESGRVIPSPSTTSDTSLIDRTDEIS